MADLLSRLWYRVRLALFPDSALGLNRQRVQDAVGVIQARLDEEARLHGVQELRLEDMSPDQQEQLYRELQDLLRAPVPNSDTEQDHPKSPGSSQST